MFKIARFEFNPFGENTYVVWDETLSAAIIDAGNSTANEDNALFDFVDRNGLKPVILLNTHAHFDHVAGVEACRKRWSIPLAVHSRDTSLLDAAPEQGRRYRLNITPLKADVDLSEMMNVRFGNSVFDIIVSPGHSAGGVCFYSPEQKVLFSGDTLFRESIGRTDLEGGDYDMIMETIVKKLLPLGDETAVYPGHGPQTTIGHESMYNPFVTEYLNDEINTIRDEF